MKKNKQLKKTAVLLSIFFILTLSIITFLIIFSREENYVLVDPILIVTTTEEYDAARYNSAFKIASWWEELGMSVIVEPMEFRDLMVRIRDQEPEKKDWDAFMLLWTGRVERADPDMFIFSIGHSSQVVAMGNNIGSYKSNEYDALAEAQRRITDIELRRTVVHAAQEVLAKDIPYITLFYRYLHSAYSTDFLHPIEPMAGEGLFHEWLPYYAKPLSHFDDFILSVAGNQEPASLNPLTANSVWEWKLLRYMYDKLARVNQSFVPEPWAAESITYIEDDMIEVILKPHLTFHDGMPVTAEDVKFSFDLMKEQNVAYFDAFIKPIKKITIEGDYKIIFTLHEPYAPFLTMTLSQIPILPKHLWQPWSLNPSTEIPLIGSGPLVFNTWKENEYIKFDRYNNHFSSENISIKGLKYMIYSNLIELVEAMERGDSHVSGAYITPDILPQLNKSSHLRVVESSDIGFYIFGFNCLRSPFDDRVFREAVARATDLNYLVENIIDGYGDIGGAGQPISTGNPFWRNDQVTIYEFDIEKAKSVLKEAGYRWTDEGKLAYPKGKK